MKKISFVLMILCLQVSLYAEQRSVEQALQVATEQMQKVQSPTNPATLTPRKAMGKNPKIAHIAKSYYAVNVSGGFVLVGSDDRLPEVIGYSDNEQEFNIDSIPDAMRYWLACYDEQMEEIALGASPRKVVAATTKTVGPLLTSKWNQGAPYNDLTPYYTGTTHSATGCVATAAAQIMYYYKYPVKGTGSHEYTWTNSTTNTKTTLSANFGATTYDWANMIDKPTTSSSAKVRNAVATLMYHCGVACDMNYGASSGAYASVMATALKTYFGYDSNMNTTVLRSSYSATAFEDILRNELDAGRPILYTGWTEEVDENGKHQGHSFVCDGYNSQGLFHINWGWGGSSDGWFLTSLMNPSEQGIGGSTGKYCRNQEVAIGIQPPKEYSLLKMDSLHVSATTISRTGSFAVTLNAIKNYEVKSFSGTYGSALYDENGTTMNRILKSASATITARQTTNKTLSSITIPSSVANGYYRLYGVYHDSGKSTWQTLHARESEDYLMIQVTSSQIVIYPANEEPQLALTNPIAFDDNSAVPHTGGRLHYTIVNTGGRFSGVLYASLYKGASLRGTISEEVAFSINKNETISGVITCNIDAQTASGQYKVRLNYKPDGGSWTELTPTTTMNRQEFTLVDDEPTDIDLRLVEAVRFDDNTAVPYEDATLYYTLYNAGIYNNGTVAAFVYAGTVMKEMFGMVQLDAQTKDTIRGSFKHDISRDILSGTYKIKMRFMQYGSSVWDDLTPSYCNDVYFSLVDKVIPDPIYVYVYDTICNGGYYQLGDEKITKGGQHIWQGTAENGADSIVTLRLKVMPTYEQDLTVVRCQYELPYIYDGKEFEQDTLYKAVFQSSYGCDSVVNLTLTVNKIESFEVRDTLYESQLPYLDTIYGLFSLPEGVEPQEYTEIVPLEEECRQVLYSVVVLEDIVEPNEPNDTPTDISLLSKSEAVLYPAVVGQGEQIVVNAAFEDVRRAVVYNCAGAMVDVVEPKSTSFSLNAPTAAGIYNILLVSSKGESKTLKFVVK